MGKIFKILQRFAAGLYSDEDIEIAAGKQYLIDGVPVGSVNFGSNGQVPYMNAGGTDFIYSSGLLYASSKLAISNIINVAGQSTYPSSPAEGDIIKLSGHISDPDSYYARIGSSWLDMLSHGGIVFFDATVGPTGADYTTIGDALGAGKNRIALIGDVIETVDDQYPADTVYIYGTKTTGKYIINFADTIISSGKIKFENIEVRFSNSFGGGVSFFQGGIPTFIDCDVVNQSTVPDTYLTDTEVHMINSTYTIPNLDDCGIGNSAASGEAYGTLRNVTLIGSGGSTSNCLFFGKSNKPSIVEGLIISGSTATDAIFRLDENCVVNGVFCTISTPKIVIGSTNLEATNIIVSCNVEVEPGGCVANIKSNNLVLNDNCKIANGNILNNLTISGDANKFYGSVGNITTIAGDRNKITNSELQNVNIAGDRNRISYCDIGDTPSGTKKITITSGSYNKIAFCSMEDDISNSGTNTVRFENDIFV